MTVQTIVYFATNRRPTAAGYSDKIVKNDPLQMTFAVATVTGIDLNLKNSGEITAIADKSPMGFSQPVADAIVGGGKNLLIFVHGFANAFKDAIKRAAFNREWFAASGDPHADTTVVAFTWPSKGEVFAAPPHIPTADYQADQARAGQSGLHLAYFFKQVEGLANRFRQAKPGGRVFLLCHSMGNYALQAGVQALFGMGGVTAPIFDEVILAAADERWDTLLTPNGGRLSNLPRLTKRITAYYSERDVAMILALAMNFIQRLGFDGPKDKTDTGEYPKAEFRFVEVTKVEDYDRFNPPDASHQYYRRSKTVRADIVSVFANTTQVPGGIIKLK
ncbi:MAG: alpha/beta fold hydrolase [Alphaproteobacteria bacterium]|nr:alpha/beta fold hydrolase [Alphaproteobacteria bacterium]